MVEINGNVQRKSWSDGVEDMKCVFPSTEKENWWGNQLS